MQIFSTSDHLRYWLVGYQKTVSKSHGTMQSSHIVYFSLVTGEFPSTQFV